jgi:proteasome lid subunit RPN8/RPN11
VHEIRISATALSTLLQGHRKAGGAEACAVLIGEAGPVRIDVLEARPVENAHPAPARSFLIDPAAALEAARRAREAGLAVVGTWHAHPSGEARLSTADAYGLEAASRGPGAGGVPASLPHAYLVSGRGAGRATVVRAFCRGAAKGPVEVPLRRLPARG